MCDKPTCSTPAGEERQDDVSDVGKAAVERGVISALLKDERITQAFEPSRAEEGVMALLLDDEHPGPWTRPEVERELGHDTFHMADALVSLCRAGLIHMEGQLVFASRAARRMDALGV